MSNISTTVQPSSDTFTPVQTPLEMQSEDSLPAQSSAAPDYSGDHGDYAPAGLEVTVKQ
jgi:hypothetical protein